MVLDRARSKGSVLRKRLSETPKSVPVMAGPHKPARLTALMVGLSRLETRFRQMTVVEAKRCAEVRRAVGVCP
jgi:hypothetical protein